MPVERFFVDAVLKESICLEGNEYHHAVRVLRLKVGETVELINGKGELASAQVESISKHSLQLWVQQVSLSSPSPFQIGSCIPLMRPSKLEWVVEKVTELGADAIYLYSADHSEKENLSSNQLERLRAITISAMKQSGRLYLPKMELVPHLSDLLSKEAQIYFGDTSEDACFFRPTKVPYSLFITGPESGFSKQERALLLERGIGVKLNPNILRAETAPIAALTLFFGFE